MTPERLAELKALAAAATPGAWLVGYQPTNPPKGHHVVSTGLVLVALGEPEIRPYDAAFIAAARTAVPELIAEVERLRAENAALQTVLTAELERNGRHHEVTVVTSTLEPPEP